MDITETQRLDIEAVGTQLIPEVGKLAGALVRLEREFISSKYVVGTFVLVQVIKIPLNPIICTVPVYVNENTFSIVCLRTVLSP